MNQELLLQARTYEKEAEKKIAHSDRPVFHFTPRTGWLNDPNGFSYYQGQYHLFYQYNPYDTIWNSMHWGHAVSNDLLHWTYLPAALAPDEAYDAYGCFSGSAVDLEDGRQLLMYTGVSKKACGKKDKQIQTQCLALGDGLHYQKFPDNPVLTESDLPVGMTSADFRDPKIWRDTNGSFCCVVASCDAYQKGAVLMFRSQEGFSWQFESILVQNDGRFGHMWECPDFFRLDEKDVLIINAMDMLPDGFEYHNGNITICQIGSFDPIHRKFIREYDQTVDYGIDFYAPQTLLTPDGRRIMIGWMQNPDTCTLSAEFDHLWFGQMTLPRELSVYSGRLIQRPIRELLLCRKHPVTYHQVHFSGEKKLPGIEGRIVELDLCVRPESADLSYHRFTLYFARNQKFHTMLSFWPDELLLKIDRSFSGSRRDVLHQRCCRVLSHSSEIHLQIILDRFSVEVFVNNGEQVLSATLMTDPDARDISFETDGSVVMDITKYNL